MQILHRFVLNPFKIVFDFFFIYLCLISQNNTMQPTTTTIQNFAFALPSDSASRIVTSIVNPMPTTVVTLSLQNKILVNGEYICAVGYTAPLQLPTVTN